MASTKAKETLYHTAACTKMERQYTEDKRSTALCFSFWDKSAKVQGEKMKDCFVHTQKQNKKTPLKLFGMTPSAEYHIVSLSSFLSIHMASRPSCLC